MTFSTPNKTSRNSKLFYDRIGRFYSPNRYEHLNTLSNRINFIIVNCLQHVLINLMQFRFKTTFTMSILCIKKFL